MKVGRRTRPIRRYAGLAAAVGVLAAAGLGIAVPAQASSCAFLSNVA
jgi:hypothetical protein